MELEYFVNPGSDDEWHDKWVELRLAWWEEQGVPKEKINLLNVEGEELGPHPIYIPLVVFPAAPPVFLSSVKSPKSFEFPVDAIVINSIVLTSVSGE